MAKVVAINPSQQTKTSRKKREEAATTVGGAAGVTASATRAAGKRGLRAESGEKVLTQMMDTVTTTTKAASQTTREAETLYASFRANLRMYANDIMKRLEAFKNSKFIGPIVNSPIAKKFSFAAGGVLAFFVMITGISNMVKTGANAVNDIKDQVSQFNAAA